MLFRLLFIFILLNLALSRTVFAEEGKRFYESLQKLRDSGESQKVCNILSKKFDKTFESKFIKSGSSNTLEAAVIFGELFKSALTHPENCLKSVESIFNRNLLQGEFADHVFSELPGPEKFEFLNFEEKYSARLNDIFLKLIEAESKRKFSKSNSANHIYVAKVLVMLDLLSGRCEGLEKVLMVALKRSETGNALSKALFPHAFLCLRLDLAKSLLIKYPDSFTDIANLKLMIELKKSLIANNFAEFQRIQAKLDNSVWLDKASTAENKRSIIIDNAHFLVRLGKFKEAEELVKKNQNQIDAAQFKNIGDGPLIQANLDILTGKATKAIGDLNMLKQLNSYSESERLMLVMVAKLASKSELDSTDLTSLKHIYDRPSSFRNFAIAGCIKSKIEKSPALKSQCDLNLSGELKTEMIATTLNQLP